MPARRSGGRAVLSAMLAVLMSWMLAGAAAADSNRALDAVVGVRTAVPAEARTAESLGRERWGSGVVIDDKGLVLTIGYLVIEASRVDILTRAGRTVPAEIVAYDHETGLGMVRALVPLAAQPLEIGSAAELALADELFVLSNVGGLSGQPVQLADRREFAGSWEYLLVDALFTAPPHQHFGGAALLDGEARLVGIGSLFVGDAAGLAVPSPGNMFIPIDLLTPIREDLLRQGQRSGPRRPWLGITAASEAGRVAVVRASPGGPAADAGLKPGDVIAAVGDETVGTLADFYRAVWRLGEAGIEVPLRIRRAGVVSVITVRSIDRAQWLRWAKGL